MLDVGQVLTDEKLVELEKRIEEEYRKANREIQAKLNDYMKQYREEDRLARERLRSGEMTRKEYNDWRYRKIMNKRQWENLRDGLAADYHNANMLAYSMSEGYRPDVYALNRNFATYQFEHDFQIDTSYTLYNAEAVERLIRDDPDFLPPPTPGSDTAKKLAENPDLRWNRQHVQSAVTQGILQGDPIDKIALRLQQVTDMNENAAKRNARTMVTSAQNAGREDAYDRIESNGASLDRIWITLLDNRVRHSHRQLHGQARDGEFFSNGLRYPGDTEGDPAEVYNCRCSMRCFMKGYKGVPKSSPKMGDMSFEKWQEAKAPKQKTPKKESYQYHATRRSSLVGIAEKGLLPNRGHVGKGVYFADSVKDALWWTSETSTGGTTVLRVKESFLKTGDFEKWAANETNYDIAESLFSGIVPLEEIEIKVNENDGEYEWWSLATYMQQNKRMYGQLSAKTRRKVDKICHDEWEEYLRRKGKIK